MPSKIQKYIPSIINSRQQSILNGIIGDSLSDQESPLAIQMSHSGQVLSGKVCIFVHGLCDSESTWQFSKETSQSYGSLLEEDFGYSPLHIRYNSGLHISTNGKLLDELIQELIEDADTPIKEIIFVGHSMGGLVVRSACHYGTKQNNSWVDLVSKTFLLGTPHQGSDIEKLGHLTSTILKTVPNLVTKGIAAIGNKRSAGIKDLRFGYLVDEDWKDKDQNRFWQSQKNHIPLLDHVEYYLIAGSLAKESKNILAEYFGDGLVNSKSVSGQSFIKSKSIDFPSDHFKTFKGISHSQLTKDREVYDQIKAWCE